MRSRAATEIYYTCVVVLVHVFLHPQIQLHMQYAPPGMYGQHYNMAQPYIQQKHVPQRQDLILIQYYQALLSEKTHAVVEIDRLSEIIKDLERKLEKDKETVKRLTTELNDK